MKEQYRKEAEDHIKKIKEETDEKHRKDSDFQKKTFQDMLDKQKKDSEATHKEQLRAMTQMFKDMKEEDRQRSKSREEERNRREKEKEDQWWGTGDTEEQAIQKALQLEAEEEAALRAFEDEQEAKA